MAVDAPDLKVGPAAAAAGCLPRSPSCILPRPSSTWLLTSCCRMVLSAIGMLILGLRSCTDLSQNDELEAKFLEERAAVVAAAATTASSCGGNNDIDTRRGCGTDDDDIELWRQQ